MSHKIIEHIQAYATDPKDESIEGIVKGFTVLADPLRTECLEKMKAWVADEDGSSLQARARWTECTATSARWADDRVSDNN